MKVYTGLAIFSQYYRLPGMPGGLVSIYDHLRLQNAVNGIPPCMGNSFIGKLHPIPSMAGMVGRVRTSVSCIQI